MRSREQVIWDFVQQWLKKAERDIKTAEILLEVKIDDYDTLAFHCQQAVEKYIKAYLVGHQIEFRKTHDLEELIHLASRKDESFLDEISFCKWLTPFGTEFRYPGDYPEVDIETAKKAYNDTILVKETILQRLKDYLSKGRPEK